MTLTQSHGQRKVAFCSPPSNTRHMLFHSLMSSLTVLLVHCPSNAFYTLSGFPGVGASVLLGSFAISIILVMGQTNPTKSQKPTVLVSFLNPLLPHL